MAALSPSGGKCRRPVSGSRGTTPCGIGCGSLMAATGSMPPTPPLLASSIPFHPRSRWPALRVCPNRKPTAVAARRRAAASWRPAATVAVVASGSGCAWPPSRASRSGGRARRCGGSYSYGSDDGYSPTTAAASSTPQWRWRRAQIWLPQPPLRRARTHDCFNI